ncbi:hypothetical protein [Streptomyces werraensis]|uniref:hypothetical protein n=1 Tax=Streptomyces werraensis TaxID=68284 RepID=UPI001CE2AE25
MTIDVAVLAATEFCVVPWLVGQKQGFFAKRGVVVENIVAVTVAAQHCGPSSPAACPSVRSATSWSSTRGRRTSRCSPVGGGAQGPYGGDFYALADNDRVSELRDIKKWAYTNPGSSVHALSLLLPKAAGLPKKAEPIAAGGVGEGAALLEAGTVNVAWLPPSLASRNEGKFKKVVSIGEYITDFHHGVITSPEYVREERHRRHGNPLCSVVTARHNHPRRGPRRWRSSRAELQCRAAGALGPCHRPPRPE